MEAGPAVATFDFSSVVAFIHRFGVWFTVEYLGVLVSVDDYLY